MECLGNDKGPYQALEKIESTENLRDMAKCQIYGIGASLVDTEVVVSDIQILRSERIGC